MNESVYGKIKQWIIRSIIPLIVLVIVANWSYSLLIREPVEIVNKETYYMPERLFTLIQEDKFREALLHPDSGIGEIDFSYNLLRKNKLILTGSPDSIIVFESYFYNPEMQRLLSVYPDIIQYKPGSYEKKKSPIFFCSLIEEEGQNEQVSRFVVCPLILLTYLYETGVLEKID